MKIFASLVLLFSCLTLSGFAQRTSVFKPDRLIVQFKNPVPALSKRPEAGIYLIGVPEIDLLQKKYTCVGVKEVKGGNVVQATILLFKDAINVRSAAKDYMNTGLFIYAEPDFVGSGSGQRTDCPPLATTPNDPLFFRQWGLNNNGTFKGIAKIGADIKMTDAWDITTGDTSIIAAILDSGCKTDHPEFSGRIIPGYNFAYNTNNVTDDYGHGTNVTSILGATGNNGLGYAGVNWKCKLMSVKVLDSLNSGYYTWWASGIYYAVDHGARVINMSIVGMDSSTLLKDAVEYAYSKNVSIVACMGNLNSGDPEYPAASSPHVIAVGATDPNDVRTHPFFWDANSGSNYGPHISVVAPGNYIYGLDYRSNTDFSYYWGGTSQATPHVTGLVSLMLGVNKNLTPEQVKTILQRTADDQVGDPSEDKPGFDPYYGWGRINAKKALTESIRVTATESVDDIASFQIFPNPAESAVALDFAGFPQGETTLRLYDAVGKLTLTKKIWIDQNRFQTNLSFPALPKGFYLLEATNGTKRQIQKLVLR